MTTLKMLPCGHEFHKECFLSWINTGRANVGFLLCLSVFLCLSLCICFSLPVSLSLSVSLPLSLCLNLCSSISAYAKYIITEAIFQFPHYKGDCPLCRQCIRCQGKRCEVYLKFFEDNDDEYCPPLRHLGSEIDYGLGVSSEKGRAGMDWYCQEAM